MVFANLEESQEKLPQSACKIVGNVFEKEIWMKTIAIVKFENSDEKLIDNFMKCLPSEIAVVSIDAKTFNLRSVRIHKASYAAIFADAIEGIYNKLGQLVLDFYQTPFLDHNSKFLILTTNNDRNFRRELKDFLHEQMSILNFVILFEEFDQIYVDFNGNQSLPLKFDHFEGDLDQKIYPDQFKNLTRQKHSILVLEEPPRVTFKTGVPRSKYNYFFKAVEAIEGSKTYYKVIAGNWNLVQKSIHNLFTQRQFEITTSLKFVLNTTAPKLMTYEEYGFCVLVPKTQETSFTGDIFLLPFDLAIWLLLGFTVMICTILWHLGERSSSCWYIPFFFCAFYHGQSVNLAAKRKVFKILLQILVFMLFVLGNAYQGLITSFMIIQPETYRMKSFDEVLQSDFNILVGENFHTRMKSNDLYNIAYNHGRVKIDEQDSNFNPFDLTKPKTETYAMTFPCEIANFLDSSGLVPDFYVIDENFMPYYVQLQMVYLSKFLKRWQLIMDWSFEAGLTQAWEKFMALTKTIKHQAIHNDILRLGDISVVFYILIFGCVLGFISLLCEIFWHDCVEPYLKRREELEKIKSVGRLRRKMRVRKIKVHPFESQNCEVSHETQNELEVLREPDVIEQNDESQEEDENAPKQSQVVEVEIHSRNENLSD